MTLDMSGLCEKRSNVIAFPVFWQLPTGIEEIAYEAAVTLDGSPEDLYVAFPWSTLVDGIRAKKIDPELLFLILDGIRQALLGNAGRAFSVSESAYTVQYMKIFRDVGISDLLCPHKRKGQNDVEGVQIRPFPLYPTQAPRYPSVVSGERGYLVNFIGAYNPRDYLSDTRQHIFDLRGQFEDFRIVQRGNRHFHRLVFDEQMQGVVPSDEIIETEEAYKKQYIEAIRNSVFTFCPTGLGLSTNRIYEALALGSIPIILTMDLDLPGDRDLWEQACVFGEDSKAGVEAALRSVRTMGEAEIDRKRNAATVLFERVGPRGYKDLLLNIMSGST